jgi:hypothetical protein
MPLGPRMRHWEGGSQVQARSQDNGLAVLVRFRSRGANFSDKEKDEASHSAGAEWDRWMPSFAALPGSEGFYFSAPHWSRNHNR